MPRVRLLSLLVAVWALMSAVAARPPAPALNIEGEWIVVSVIRSGQPDLSSVDTELTFTADRVFFTHQPVPMQMLVES